MSRKTKKKSKYRTVQKKRKGGFGKSFTYLANLLRGRTTTKQPLKETKSDATFKNQSVFSWFTKHKSDSNLQTHETEPILAPSHSHFTIPDDVQIASLKLLPPTPQTQNPYETSYEPPNREAVLELVKKDGLVLEQYVELQSDIGVAVEAVVSNPKAMDYVDPSIKSFVLETVRAIELSNTDYNKRENIETITSDKEISNEKDALEMVEKDPDSLRSVSKSLFENIQFLKKIKHMYDKKKATNLSFRINYRFFFDCSYTGFVSNPNRLILSDLSSYGVFKYDDGDVLAGLWKNNKLIEGSKLYKRKGFFVKGKFNLNGQLEGEGQVQYLNEGRNSFTYFGQFVKGQIQGQGKMVFEDGNTLVGLFEDAFLKHGSITFKNGYVRKGQFKKHQLHGEGVEIIDGTLVKGNFQDGNLNGVGIIKVGSEIAICTFKNNVRTGRSIIDNDFETFDVLFEHNKKNGKGSVFEKKKNTITHGVWENDKLEGSATIVAKYGTHQLSLVCKYKNDNIIEDEYFCIVDDYFRLNCRIDETGDILAISKFLHKDSEEEIEFDNQTPKVDVRLFQHIMIARILLEDQESFLKMCGLYHTEEEIDTFKKSIKPADDIRLIVLCHGSLLKTEQLIYDVHRISSVPPGACSFSSFNDKMDYFTIALTKDTDQFIHRSLERIESTVRRMCNHVIIEKEDDTSEQKEKNTDLKLYKKRCKEGN